MLLSIRVLAWAIAFVLGGLHALVAASSQSMNPDGVSYLDIGDAYLRGDWGAAISSVWSPMYSWILGLAMRIVSPSLEWEFPLVHAVNFLVFLGTLACFEFFWLRLARSQSAAASENGVRSLPQWAWLCLGYALFLWSALTLTEVWAVTPDMLMAAFVYLAAGLVVRIGSDAASWRHFALLGLVLGLGYLAKAILLPLAPVFLGVAALIVGSPRIALPRVLVAGVVFLVIAGSFIAIVSREKGYLTFGDAGRITYVRHVTGVDYPAWQGEAAAESKPKHPVRRILDVPPIYEFGSPVSGTYPISYDPSYWYDGFDLQVDLGRQVRAIAKNCLFYLDLLLRQQGALLAGILILYGMGQRVRLRSRDLLLSLSIAAPAVVALGTYALVYVDGRYLAPFLVLLWAGLLSGLRLPDYPEARRLASVASAVVLVFSLASLAEFNVRGATGLQIPANSAQSAGLQASSPARPDRVAAELHRLGVEPGDKVAVVGYGFDSFWARLARVKIVAELREWEAAPFWFGDSSLQEKAIQAFASTGARAIVAENVPTYASVTGWHRVGRTGHYVLVLPRAVSASTTDGFSPSDENGLR